MLKKSAFILACLSATVIANKTMITQDEEENKSCTKKGLGDKLRNARKQ